jgi:LysM repeat protein
VKGKLLYDGIENTMTYIKKFPEKDNLIVDVQKLKERKSNEAYLQEIARKDSLNSLIKVDTTKIQPTRVLEEKIVDVPTKQVEVQQVAESKKDTVVSANTPLVLPTTTELDTQKVSNPIISSSVIADSLVSKEALLDSLNTVAVVAEQKRMEAKRMHTATPISDKISVLYKEEFLQIFQVNQTHSNSKKVYKEQKNSTKTLMGSEVNSSKDSLIVTLPKPIRKAPPKPRYTYYRVRSGDNLSEIADRHGCTVQQLKTWNRLRGSGLDIGQTLVIQKK